MTEKQDKFIETYVLTGNATKAAIAAGYSEKTAKSLTEMLVKAVDDGTGTNAKIKHFSIAGKTSTAQRPNSDGGYSGYVPGFIGYPTNVQERFVIYVYVDNPQGKHYYGGTVAAPVFKKIAEHILFKNKEFNKLALTAPDMKNKEFETSKKFVVHKRKYRKGEIPSFLGLDKKSAIQIAKKIGVKIFHRGIGVVSKQSLDPGSPINSESFINLMYSPPSYE